MSAAQNEEVKFTNEIVKQEKPVLELTEPIASHDKFEVSQEPNMPEVPKKSPKPQQDALVIDKVVP